MARIRVRARALDMLGRQQMASIPNALHELLKNAYDAYAGTARTDYYRADKLLVLQDDGVGMTREDFETRWLTLGTESKVGANTGQGGPYKDPNKPDRPILGEKGIGRLAIATIGPQVLILSRAERESGLCPMVAAFINWSFFEAPGIDLDAIEIPILEIPVGSLPTSEDLERLLNIARDNRIELGSKIGKSFADRIRSEMAGYWEKLHRLETAIAELPLATSRGTAFLILPTDPILEHDIDVDQSDDLPPPLLKILRGFSNTMMPRDEPIPIVVSFFDHRRDGSVIDLLGEREFFVPEEFEQADHHIEGRFDEYGQFTGQVQIFREPVSTYTVPWDGAQSGSTKCGPFRIKFAYLQGNSKESLVPNDEWIRLVAKLNRFGGLYVYRDGIRVLPYGNTDYDFINMENRRSKAYKDWFFSYRRIFGAIEITNAHNYALTEKAGREGFRENLAYRQFKNMLENLFKQLAIDWFREKTATYGNFNVLKDNLKRQAELLDKREKSIKQRKKKLDESLNTFFQAIETDVPGSEIHTLRERMSNVLNTIETLSQDEASVYLLELESDMKERLAGLRDRFRIPPPRGFGPKKATQKDLERAEAIRLRLEAELFRPFELEIDERITRAIGEMHALVTRRKRIRQSIEQKERRDESKARALVKTAKEETGKLGKEITTRTREGLSRVDTAFKLAMANLERESLADMDDGAARRLQQEIEEKLSKAIQGELENLEHIRDNIQTVLESIREDTPLAEMLTAIEQKSATLEEELDYKTELAQLGSAIGIIQHEFEAAVAGIQDNISGLERYATHNIDISQNVGLLRTHFEHLNTYLKLFTPLNRRKFSRAVDITGKNIRIYLLQIFEERFKRHHVDWTTTDRFEGHTVSSYPATFLPPFINIVDNAVYWLSRTSTGEIKQDDGQRIISFDADENGFLIGNTGPGIVHRDADRIFEMAFTRKLRGRGMGLAIARKSLRDAGFDITLERVGDNTQPLFRIWTAPSSPDVASKQ
jgi:hypothetical protein